MVGPPGLEARPVVESIAQGPTTISTILGPTHRFPAFRCSLTLKLTPLRYSKISVFDRSLAKYQQLRSTEHWVMQILSNKWWAHQDLNLGPVDYESIALTN